MKRGRPESSRRRIRRAVDRPLVLCGILPVLLWMSIRCEGFSSSRMIDRICIRGSHKTTDTAVCVAYAVPAARKESESASKAASTRPTSRRQRQRRYKKKPSGNPNTSSSRCRQAERVEELLLRALEVIQSASQNPPVSSQVTRPSVPDFPSVRDCNAALATFADGGDFLRALRLYVKMRKVASLAQSMRSHSIMAWTVPAPTLVTYSTLMSRAVQVGKAPVALRLWNLMKLQAEFFTSPKRQVGSMFVLLPDVKAANILMNVYAKMADVQNAQDLMRQMRDGNGKDVPRLKPNLVTYNTLVNACYKAGDLDAALEAKQLLEDSGVRPDARTYTSLIATVARKASTASGANDPSLAFALLREMKTKHNIRPNGMTYSALIDVCGRCGRADLALQGLRTMLRQKVVEQERRAKTKTYGSSKSGNATNTDLTSYSFPNEVGAWTAAIDAAGKAGRIETALRLFSSMSTKFGVQPNTVTCGCLTDCLLRHGYMAEALDVLRYMEREGLSPSEVMYTSLMTSAERLVQVENKRTVRSSNSNDDDILRSSGTRAIEVYTELMRSLMQDTNHWKRNLQTRARNFSSRQELTLTKVFLVFQEMKAVGAEPDLACYNALLRACAKVGDRSRALEVMSWIRVAGLTPNDRSWRELIRAARDRSELAEATWNMALTCRGDEDRSVTWRPHVATLGALASSYLRHARVTDVEKQRELYRKVIGLYYDVVRKEEQRGLHLIDIRQLKENPRVMLLFLQAAVALRHDIENQVELRELAESIVELDCIRDPSGTQDNRLGFIALKAAKSWLAEDADTISKA